MENTKAEKDLINCLDGSTNFMRKIIDEGYLDKNDFLKQFIIAQIKCNGLTIQAYKSSDETIIEIQAT